MPAIRKNASLKTVAAEAQKRAQRAYQHWVRCTEQRKAAKLPERIHDERLRRAEDAWQAFESLQEIADAIRRHAED